MVVTLFWSRFRDGMEEKDQADYREDAEKMHALAVKFPGFHSYKRYTAEDGERLSVVMFESEEQLRAWREFPQHREVQRRARESYYQEYRSMTCSPLREHQWSLERESSSGGIGEEAAGK